MAEPQPPHIREGADVDDETPAVLASAEDRKAAAALSSLDARGEDDEGTSKKTNLDQEALGKAMSRLELVSKGKESNKGKSKAGEVEKKKPVVKVDQADVSLLVRAASQNSGSGVDKCIGGAARVEQAEGYRTTPRT